MSLGVGAIGGSQAAGAAAAMFSMSARGMSYNDAFDGLKRHLSDLANPLLAKDLLQKLDVIAKDYIDTQNGIIGSFADMNLPADTLAFLGAFSGAIVEEARNCPSVSAMDKKIENVKKDLCQLVQESVAVSELWPELEELLKIPEIRALKNDDVARIMGLIKRDDRDTLRDFIKPLLSPVARESIAKQLSDTDYEDLDTLLGEVVGQKPKNKDGLDRLWDMPPIYFMNKTLYFSDPESFQSYNGTIVNCWQDQASWIFNLDNGVEIRVAPNFRIGIVQRYKYRFWNALCNILSHQQTFILEGASDRPPVEGITPGIYRLGVMKDENPLVRSSYRTIEILDAATKDKRYLLKAYYKDSFDNVSEIEIHEWNPTDGDYAKRASYTPANLNAIYNAINTEMSTISSINAGNVGRQMRVRDERDENKVKLVHLKQITEQVDQIRTSLLKPENRKLLDALIDDLAKSQLQSVHPDLLAQNPDLMGRLQTVVQKYAQDLQQVRRGEDILKEIVIEANYALLVDKEKSVLVSRTMELLNEAVGQNAQMVERDVIFFMGNTGSGKSTAVGYFLGLPLETFINRVGEEVVRIKKDASDVDPGVVMPKIGQSLGESETLYTKAYPLSDTLTLGDCPGFNDTRGSDYELCTNLSIDRAVQKTNRIRAIILTVPVHSFLADRGNPIIDLIDTVRERFPHTFDPDRLADNARVFMLITKTGQARADTVRALKDGRRIDELFAESQKAIQKFLQERQTGAMVDDYELTSIQRRNRVWKCLQTMQMNNQIHFIDVVNKIDKKRLLKLFSSEAGIIDKKQYVPAMQARDMQRKFGKYIEMSTKTWTLHIFSQYLQAIPDAIEAAQDQIGEKAANIRRLEAEKIIRQARAKAKGETQTKLETLIEQLQKAQADPTKLSQELKNELQKGATQHTSEAIVAAKRELGRCGKDIQEVIVDLNKMKAKVEGFEKAKQDKQQKIQILEADYTRLSAGTRREPLWSSGPSDPSSMMTLCYYNAGAQKAAFEEVRQLRRNEISSTTEVRAGDYRGEMFHHAYIEKQFRLVPTDPAMRADFEARQSSGQHVAHVSGERFRLDLGVKTEASGKKIVYSFLTQWQGDVMPCIKIEHTLPNIDYNEATLANISGQLTILRRELEEVRLELEGGGAVGRGKKQEKADIEKKVEGLQKEKADLEGKVTQLEAASKLQKIGEILVSKQKELEGVVHDKKTLEDNTEIDVEIETNMKEKEAIINSLADLVRRKRNFAIIIKLQEQTAKLLREFSEMVLVGKKGDANEAMAKLETVTTCQEFIDMYDKNIHRIKEECAKDLAAAI